MKRNGKYFTNVVRASMQRIFNTIKLDFDPTVTSDTIVSDWFLKHLPLVPNDASFLQSVCSFRHIWLCNSKVCWQQGHDRISYRLQAPCVYYHSYPDLIHIETDTQLDQLITLFLLSFPNHSCLYNYDDPNIR